MENLLNKKWRILLRRSWPFKYIPFVDFVLVAGSMALGTPRPESDFDVIVGARPGRIFTVRFFCWLIFGLLGRRANHRGENHPRRYKDKFCFNHFVTEKSYRLSPPYNAYWEKLYQNLAPIYGMPALISKFQRANDWAGLPNNYNADWTKKGYKKAALKQFLENIFSGKVGDYLEAMLKKYQLAKIEKSLKRGLGYKPRVRFSDDELEFHPDTKRTEELTK